MNRSKKSWQPYGICTLKEHQVLRSMLRTILHGYVTYRVNKPSESHLPGCQLLHQLTEQVMKAGNAECEDPTTKELYVKELVVYLDSLKRQTIEIILVESFDVSAHTTPKHIVSAAATVGHLAAVKALLKTHGPAAEQVKPLIYPGAYNEANITLFGDPIVAAAAAGSNTVLEYLVNYFDDRLEQSSGGSSYAHCKRKAIFAALRVAVAAGHEHIVVYLTGFFDQHVAPYYTIDPVEAKSILAAVARLGNKDMLSPILKAAKQSKVSTKLLRTACRYGSADLLRHIVRKDLYHHASCRGLLRYAVKSRSYVATKTLLQLGFESNNDGLVNLTIKNSDPHMLKLLIRQGIKITSAHAIRAEQSLKKIGYKDVSLEYLVALKQVRWQERTGWHLWSWFSHLEHVTSCDRRKQKVLTMYLVFKAARSTNPAKNWKWFTPLLVKLDDELMQDDFWKEEVRRLA